MTKAKPTIAAKTPCAVDVKEGKKYWWCACGLSKKQPFCDGSHKGTEFEPKIYTADKTGTVFFCACKHSAKAPLCDGTHNKL
ncbi:hypothetical protein R50073_34180 [Maricurvus nonylphenolicus]|uniref:CDGSH iron-sulfur domain-containing protein n=1 Tax=Maricurvus nonylphenolicus TaxID=1008307 RepID=UPI0036F1F4A9